MRRALVRGAFALMLTCWLAGCDDLAEPRPQTSALGVDGFSNARAGAPSTLLTRGGTHPRHLVFSSVYPSGRIYNYTLVNHLPRSKPDAFIDGFYSLSGVAVGPGGDVYASVNGRGVNGARIRVFSPRASGHAAYERSLYIGRVYATHIKIDANGYLFVLVNQNLVYVYPPGARTPDTPVEVIMPPFGSRGLILGMALDEAGSLYVNTQSAIYVYVNPTTNPTLVQTITPTLQERAWFYGIAVSDGEIYISFTPIDGGAGRYAALPSNGNGQVTPDWEFKTLGCRGYTWAAYGIVVRDRYLYQACWDLGRIEVYDPLRRGPQAPLATLTGFQPFDLAVGP